MSPVSRVGKYPETTLTEFHPKNKGRGDADNK